MVPYAARLCLRRSQLACAADAAFSSQKPDENWAGRLGVQGNLALHLLGGVIHPASIVCHQLQPLKRLHEPANDVLQLTPGKVLPETNTGAVIEREKLPGGRRPAFPAVRIELVSRGADNVVTALDAHV